MNVFPPYPGFTRKFGNNRGKLADRRPVHDPRAERRADDALVHERVAAEAHRVEHGQNGARAGAAGRPIDFGLREIVTLRRSAPGFVAGPVKIVP